MGSSRTDQQLRIGDGDGTSGSGRVAAPARPAGRRAPARTAAQRYASTAVVVIAPAALLAGIVHHPFIADLRDKDAVAAALDADHARWLVAHLLVAVAGALVTLAFLAVRGALRDRGEQRWSALSVPFVVLGGSLFVMLPAMEIAVLAASRAGADPAAVLRRMDPTFAPLVQVGALVFAVGMVCLAAAVVRSRIAGGATRALVVAALLVTAVSRFLPFTAALTVGAVALVVALWPLAAAVARPAPRS